MDKTTYDNCHRYVRGNDQIAHPGEHNLRQYWRSRGRYLDGCGFPVMLEIGWRNRKRRLQWATRKLLVAILGPNFEKNLEKENSHEVPRNT